MMRQVPAFPLAAATVLISFVLVSFALAGAGHTHDGYNFGEPGRKGQVDRTIELSVDEMNYSVDRIKVEAGETIRFVIQNGSEIEHDFTLGDQAMQEAHRVEMAKMMEAGNAMMEHDDVNAIFLAPQETKELIWTFSKSGKFEFACNVPGHYEAGMHGQITVSSR